MGLTTTTAGWFPKPAELRRARWLFSEEQIDAAALREAELQATRETLQLQASLGLDVLVDGQMERADMVGYFAEHLDGMDDGLLVRCWGNRYYRRPRIEGAIERPAPITAPRFEQVREMTSGKLKAVLTGPYTLMDWSFDEHYGSREACCRAFADVVRAEAEELLAAGAAEIQIDEPAISARPDEMPFAHEALAHVTAPLAGKARTWVHLCYGNLPPVLDAVLALPGDGLYLDLVNSRFAPLKALATAGEWPADKLFCAGVFDVTSSDVEPVDELKRRIERVLKAVPASRLSLGPDTGLRALTLEQIRAKLANLVEAAAAF